uniref:Complex III subunit VI n=1 Tax=Aegilops tauschii subsp. strangulata TaxID=200361 RepID=A0A453HMN8_AEGTS
MLFELCQHDTPMGLLLQPVWWLYDAQKCIKRVEADDTGHKHCTGQYFDYWSCIDKCVAPKLFEKLK